MNYGMTMKAISLAALGLGLLCTKAYAANYYQGSPPQSAPSTTSEQTQMSAPAPAVTPAPEENSKTAGEAFLEKNKNKPGVITLPDGLQYKILIEGQGERPTDSDTVTVDYSGTLVNGTVFDSSYKRGEPAVFPVNGVIPGWTEALKLMKVGSTWKLYIPAALAYGAQGAPPAIGPNETLIFKVHLIAVNKEGST